MIRVLGIGPGELILILIIVLIVFGPGRLPEVARAMGKAMSEFKRASTGVQRLWDEVTREETGQVAGKTTNSAAAGAPPDGSAATGVPACGEELPQEKNRG